MSAAEMREAAAAAYDSIADPLLNEPCAFKRACFRAGWDAAVEKAPLPDEEGMAQRVARLEAALLRVATPEAFFVATSSVDPEALGRMIYAQAVLDGATLEDAAAKAEAECKARAINGGEP